MRKEKTFLFLVLGWWLLAGLASVSFAGSSTVIFNGGGSIKITTSAPGLVDQCQVSGGDVSVKQQLTTHSPTTIVRQAGFSGGGSITAVSSTSTMKFGVDLKADQGRLSQFITTGSPTQIKLAADATGDGNLLIQANSKKYFDFNFVLVFDYSQMSVLASADPFAISWITDFDDQMQVTGIATNW